VINESAVAIHRSGRATGKPQLAVIPLIAIPVAVSLVNAWRDIPFHQKIEMQKVFYTDWLVYHPVFRWTQYMHALMLGTLRRNSGAWVYAFCGGMF
jgi:hypothetical protein